MKEHQKKLKNIRPSVDWNKVKKPVDEKPEVAPKSNEDQQEELDTAKIKQKELEEAKEKERKEKQEKHRQQFAEFLKQQRKNKKKAQVEVLAPEEPQQQASAAIKEEITAKPLPRKPEAQVVDVAEPALLELPPVHAAAQEDETTTEQPPLPSPPLHSSNDKVPASNTDEEEEPSSSSSSSDENNKEEEHEPIPIRFMDDDGDTQFEESLYSVQSLPQSPTMSLEDFEEDNNLGLHIDIHDLPLPNDTILPKTPAKTREAMCDMNLGLRIEALRQYCESKFGEDLFIQLYRYMRDESQDLQSNEDSTNEKILALLGSKQTLQMYIPKISQLIYCEDDYYGSG